jgi:hypothetical protein
MDFEEALTILAEKEEEMLDALADSLESIKACTDIAQADLLAYRQTLPESTLAISKARGVVEQTYSSVLSLQQQITYMLENVTTQLSQFGNNQQVAPPMVP